MTSSRWQNRSFLTLLPLIKRTTNNYLIARYHWKNPWTWGWGWSTPLHHRDQDSWHLRVREATTRWLFCPSPRPVQLHAERFLLSLWLLQWEKRTQGGQPESHQYWGCFVGTPVLISYHRDYGGGGTLKGSATGNLSMTEKAGRGLQQWALGSWQSSYPHYQVVTSVSGFAHLQNQVVGALWWRNLVGSDLPALDPQMRRLLEENTGEKLLGMGLDNDSLIWHLKHKQQNEK